MKTKDPVSPFEPSAAKPSPYPRATLLWQAWWLFLGLILASGVSLWTIQTLPSVVDPEWKPVFGPGFGGPRPSTVHWLGVGLFGLALTVGPLVGWWRPIRGLGLGLGLGWIGWAILFWLY